MNLLISYMNNIKISIQVRNYCLVKVHNVDSLSINVFISAKYK